MNIPQVNVLAYREIFRHGVKTVDERCIARLTFLVILLSFPSPLFRSLTSSWKPWFLVCLHRSRPWAFFLLFFPRQICRCSVKPKATFYICYISPRGVSTDRSSLLSPPPPHASLSPLWPGVCGWSCITTGSSPNRSTYYLSTLTLPHQSTDEIRLIDIIKSHIIALRAIDHSDTSRTWIDTFKRSITGAIPAPGVFSWKAHWMMSVQNLF